MKAIYTSIGDKIYQIEQDTTAPIRDVKLLNKNLVNLTTDVTQKTVSATMYFTDWVNTGIKSNKENATDLINYIKDKTIVQIDKIQSVFTVAIDYSLCNSEGQEIEHSVVIKPMQNIDFIYPLGVMEDNECVYRRFKRLTANIDWVITNKLPYGIICTKNQKTIININSVSIYIDRFENEDVNNHPSIHGQSYNRRSCTINTALENKLLIYSTSDEGYEISPIINEFNPRIIELNLTVDLTKFIVIYNDATINQLLADNVRIKNGETDGGNEPDDNNDGCSCDCNCHNKTNTDSSTDSTNENENNNDQTGENTVDHDVSTDTDPTGDSSSDSSSDGSNSSSDNEPVYTYTRSSISNSYALLVVPDTYPDDLFDSKTMVHKSVVMEVIPDITENEYVLRSEIVIP
jgi:hypothetical protein